MEPVDVGFGVEGDAWTLALFNGFTADDFRRLVRRSVEVSGDSETLDFFVSLADPATVEVAELRRKMDSLNSAFAHMGLIEWNFVLPGTQWLERLRSYHGLKACLAIPALDEEVPAALSSAITGMGLSFLRIEPEGVLKFLSAHLNGLTPPPYPYSVEGFTAHDSDPALLMTADARVFAAWRDVMSSPAVGLLPEGWDTYMAKYGYMLARVLPHFSAGEVNAGQTFP